MYFSMDIPLSKIINKYCAIHKQVIQMGLINNDQFLASWLINGLNDNPIFETIQSNIMSSANDPYWSSKVSFVNLSNKTTLFGAVPSRTPKLQWLLPLRPKGSLVCSAHTARNLAISLISVFNLVKKWLATPLIMPILSNMLLLVNPLTLNHLTLNQLALSLWKRSQHLIPPCSLVRHLWLPFI
jgi:hypothetical protein